MTRSDDLLAGLSIDGDSNIEEMHTDLATAPSQRLVGSGLSPSSALFDSPHSVLMDGTGGNIVTFSLFWCQEITKVCRGRIGVGIGSNIQFCCNLVSECSARSHASNKLLIQSGTLYMRINYLDLRLCYLSPS
jgi:hypothetical protein